MLQYNAYAFGMLSLGRILISDLVVTNLFMQTLSGITWPHLFYTEDVFA